MPKFSYKAKDKDGSYIEGKIDAISTTAAEYRLKEKNLTPLILFEEKPIGALDIGEFFGRFQKIKQDEIIVFVSQLSSILNAGVPLLESLEAVYEQVGSTKFKAIILDMRKDIEGGSSFSDALGRNDRVFSKVFVSMVRAGEKAGILGDVLERLAGLLEKDFENVQKIKSATRYPVVVLGAVAVAFVVVITYVIPKFSLLYANFKTELPLPTRILLSLNYYISTYWILMIGAIVGLFYVFKAFSSSPKGRLILDRFVISVPVFGMLIKKMLLARFCRMLGSMFKSGIPIVESLEISGETIENKVLSTAIEKVKEEVVKGAGLSTPMRDSSIFPPLVVQMVSIGEKSGSLESMLLKVADYFDRDADYTIKNLTPLLEPLLILIMAVLVVMLALGVMLPMWDIVKFVKTT